MKTRVFGPQALVFAAMFMLFAIGAMAQVECVWYFNDGPQSVVDGEWTDSLIGPLWEHMGPNAIDADDFSCSVMDLPPDQVPIWACSDPDNENYVEQHWWAEIWLGNNYEDMSEPVTATLGLGTCGPNGSFQAISPPVTSFVTAYMGDYDCGAMYMFDFGIMDLVQPGGASLILRIVYEGEAGDTHIHWDGWNAPSALHCAPGTTAARESSWSLIKALYRAQP